MRSFEWPPKLVALAAERKITPLVGSGVSLAVRSKTGESLFPTWKSLLWKGGDYLDEERKFKKAKIVRSLLEDDPPELVEAAERLKANLGARWVELLKESFEVSRSAVDDETLALARSVWKLGSRVILTTNYDNTLKWACPSPWVHDVQILGPRNTAEHSLLLRDDFEKPKIWHLHGHVDDSTNMILTEESYDRLYGEHGSETAHYASAIATLRAFIAYRSILFIGFSLRDQYFAFEMETLKKVFDGALGPHYLLIHEDELDQQYAGELGVFPIPFSDYSNLSVYLEELAEEVRHLQEEARAPEPAPIRVDSARAKRSSSLALTHLTHREEVIRLPSDNGQLHRVLAARVDTSLVVGRCYWHQLRSSARRRIETAPGTFGVGWVLAWDDRELNQVLTRQSFSVTPTAHHFGIENLTDYSPRPQKFLVISESGDEYEIEPGAKVEMPVARGGGRFDLFLEGTRDKRLYRCHVGLFSKNEISLPVIQTEDSAFWFLPTGSTVPIRVSFIGLWIPVSPSELPSLVERMGGALEIPLTEVDAEIELFLDPGTKTLRVAGWDALKEILRAVD